MSGVIEVGYSASINNPDYLLEEDKSNNLIQITALNDGTSGLCILTQNESGNKFSPNYNISNNQDFTIKTIGLGSYALKRVNDLKKQLPPSYTLILSCRFNTPKKCPVGWNFYW